MNYNIYFGNPPPTITQNWYLELVDGTTSVEKMSEIYEWLIKNIGPQYTYLNHTGIWASNFSIRKGEAYIKFDFKNKYDALLFKLNWTK